MRREIFMILILLIACSVSMAQELTDSQPTVYEEITVENVAQLEVVFELPDVLDFAWSPDGSYLAVAVGHQVVFYSVPELGITSKVLDIDSDFSADISNGIGFIPQSDLLYVDISGSPRTIYSLETLEAVQTLSHKGTFSHDGTMYATGGWDTVEIFDIETDTQIFEYVAEFDETCDYICGITDVAWSLDDSQIVFTSFEGVIPAILDIGTGEIFRNFVEPEPPHFHTISSDGLQYHPNGTVILSHTFSPGYAASSSPRFTDISTGALLARIEVGGTSRLSFNRNGDLAVVGVADPEYRIQDEVGNILIFDVQDVLERGALGEGDAVFSTWANGFMNYGEFSPNSEFLAIHEYQETYGPIEFLRIWGVPKQ